MSLLINVIAKFVTITLIFCGFILRDYFCWPIEKVKLSSWHGDCGNSRFDNYSSTINRHLNLTVIANTTRNQFRMYATHQFETKTMNIISEPIIIRLSVAYDETFAEEHKNTKRIEKFVRNLIYQTQLIFNQPEMSTKVKFNFVVVDLKETDLKFSPDLEVEDILYQFGQIDSAKVDLNLLLTFRNLFDFGLFETQENNSKKIRKILGLASVGTFCQKSRIPALVFNANSFGTAIVLAHELAHSLNVDHDGNYNSRIESKCDSESFIMSPSMGPNKMTWSSCSIDAILNFLQIQEVFDCIYDTNRIKNVKPINEEFDFASLVEKNQKPGMQITIDEQCSLSLDTRSKSMLNEFGENSDDSYETCQSLICSLDSATTISLGPALTGSRCKKARTSSTFGTCLNGFCQ